MPPKKKPRAIAGDAASAAAATAAPADESCAEASSDHDGASACVVSGVPKRRARQQKRAPPKAKTDGAGNCDRAEAMLSLPGDSRCADISPPLRAFGDSCKCGLCGTVSVTSSVPLHINACDRCYGPAPSFELLGTSWEAVVTKYNTEPTFKSKYDIAVIIAMMPEDERPFPGREVFSSRTLGFKTKANFELKLEADCKSGCRGVAPADIGQQTASVPNPVTGDEMNAIVVKHSTMPAITLEVYCRSETALNTKNMDSRCQVRPDQAKETWDKMRGKIKSLVPSVAKNGTALTAEQMLNAAEALLRTRGVKIDEDRRSRVQSFSSDAIDRLVEG
jgi:hypothetical protein